MTFTALGELCCKVITAVLMKFKYKWVRRRVDWQIWPTSHNCSPRTLNTPWGKQQPTAPSWSQFLQHVDNPLPFTCRRTLAFSALPIILLLCCFKHTAIRISTKNVFSSYSFPLHLYSLRLGMSGLLWVLPVVRHSSFRSSNIPFSLSSVLYRGFAQSITCVLHI